MRDLKEIKNTINMQIKADGEDGFAGIYYDKDTDKWLSFIFSYGMGWEHLSVSMKNKTPSWEQMCRMKDIFWNENEVCMQLHPKKSEYVNIHEHCLHIWRPVDKEIPTPDKIMV